MGFREKLEDRIRRKEQEVQEYYGKIAEAKAYLQGLQEALRLLPRDKRTGEPAENILRPGSKVFKTLEFLKKQGKPMHLAEILKGIGLEPTKKERTSLAGSLGWYVRRNEIFSRPAPGTFGLVDMDKGTAALEPPDDFGLLESEETDEEPIHTEIPF